MMWSRAVAVTILRRSCAPVAVAWRAGLIVGPAVGAEIAALAGWAAVGATFGPWSWSVVALLAAAPVITITLLASAFIGARSGAAEPPSHVCDQPGGFFLKPRAEDYPEAALRTQACDEVAAQIIVRVGIADDLVDRLFIGRVLDIEL